MASTIVPGDGHSGISRAGGRARALMRRATVALLIATAPGCAYDDLAAQQERISRAWSGVERELDRRGALLGDLLPVVRANAAKETALLSAAADARARMLAASARSERMEAASGLGETAIRLVALAAHHPALRDDPRFQSLARDVADTNRRLAAEEQRFNAAVRDYNGALDGFPTRLYAKLLGFEAAPYLHTATSAESGEADAAAPST
ncbi:MAG: LemA family protein [bacterium]|nr:LemA family protein [bacterium]